MEKQRCLWYKNSSEEMLRYHDEEWGVPCHNDRGQFEFLILESAQAGLSWQTILHKRANYRRCFANFDPEQVANFTKKDVERLLKDPGIIRNRNKIESAVNNARIFLEIAAKNGSFCNWFWRFTEGKTIQNSWKNLHEVPAQTPLSKKIAKEMKQSGFRFLGSITLYSHMQATGMVNDHLISCFRYAELQTAGRMSPAS